MEFNLKTDINNLAYILYMQEQEENRKNENSKLFLEREHTISNKKIWENIEKS